MTIETYGAFGEIGQRDGQRVKEGARRKRTSGLPVARPPTSEKDLERLRRAAWRREGVLNVQQTDGRLSWPERELIRALGARLYGGREDGA
ncbi:MAG: hypothetical protein IIC57_11410 [Proteobacteria bacterium]|nr:hypothetical protein [Pseudomonadota bacterium]